MRRGNDVQFSELVRYIIDRRSRPLNDYHWTPQTVMCQPCRVRYDFIGHYETLYDDARYVLERIALSSRVRFPSVENRSAALAERLRSMYTRVPAADVDRLKEIYMADFAAFGYDI